MSSTPGRGNIFSAYYSLFTLVFVIVDLFFTFIIVNNVFSDIITILFNIDALRTVHYFCVKSHLFVANNFCK